MAGMRPLVGWAVFWARGIHGEDNFRRSPPAFRESHLGELVRR